MPPGSIKRRFPSPVLAAVCAPITILLTMALALFQGGSFAVSGIPQDPSVSAFFHGYSEISSLSAALAEAEERTAERFGVSFAEQAAEDPFYRFLPCSDAEAYSALLTLERALEAYPQGFFDKVPVRFLLCGGVRSREPSFPDRPSGVTRDIGGCYLIALDVRDGLSERTVYHEVCHAVDKLIAASDIAPGFEAGWAALNPPGFKYFGSYTDEKGFPLADTGDPSMTFEGCTDPRGVCFLNRYSKTFPEEDRAVLFETLMRSGANSRLFGSPTIIMKLSYYFACIRGFLDPEGRWQGPTSWELRLKALTQTRGEAS